MRACYICKTPTSQCCVGCGDTARFVCDSCALACAWCQDPGPYCNKCFTCQSGDYCGEPGNHECWSCNSVIKKGEQRVKCVECDEGLYHMECACKCSCGEDHYVCESDSHWCIAKDLHEPGQGCCASVCEKNCSVPGLYDNNTVWLLCPEHQEYLKEEIERRYKKLKSEK